MAVRTRVDVWSISVGTQEAARTQPWHPVLDTYAGGVGAMTALDPQLPPDSWRYVANTHGIDAQTPPRLGIWRPWCCSQCRRSKTPMPVFRALPEGERGTPASAAPRCGVEEGRGC